MNTNLDFCLALHRAHASLQLKLDDELGTYHGISFSDFALLNLLAQADGGRVSIPELVRPIGQPQSAVLRQLIVLEKMWPRGARRCEWIPSGRASPSRACAGERCTRDCR
jgi:hypothetical protein